jgi:hypothetical protein
MCQCAMGTVIAALISVSSAAVTPVVRSAHISITVISPDACEVAMELTVAGASQVEHRLQTFDGGRVELVDIEGARQVNELRTIGRTQSLLVRPDQPSYGFRYRIWHHDGDRCPVWLPTVPTSGQPGTVQIEVELPPAVVPGSTMPTFTWTGSHGSVGLAHVPAIVRLPYREEGEPPVWSVSRMMDVTAIAICLAGSILWLTRMRR